MLELNPLFTDGCVLCRGRETGHIYPELEKAFPWFRKMGFNLLRYGIYDAHELYSRQPKATEA